MSLLVAIKKGNCVYLGSDSQITTDSTKQNTLGENHYKIRKIHSNLLFGGSGSVFQTDLIYSHKEWFQPCNKQPLTKKFLVTEIVPKIISLFKRYDVLKIEDSGCAKFDVRLLFAQEKRLFYMDYDGSIYEITEYIAVGSSKLDCIPIIKKSTGTPDQIILQCLQYSSYHDEKVSPPFLTINTRDLTFKTHKGRFSAC